MLLQRAAFWGAILQFTGLGYLLWPRFVCDMQAPSPEDPLSWVLLAAREIVGDPAGLLCAYCAMEGLLRALIIACMGEIYPSLPVAVLMQLAEGVGGNERREPHVARQFTIHRRPADRVEQVGDRLVIATSRLKPEWSNAAVCFAGLYYKAGGPHAGQHGLPYVYVLRPWPDGIVIRRTQFYDGPGFAFTPRKNRAS